MGTVAPINPNTGDYSLSNSSTIQPWPNYSYPTYYWPYYVTQPDPDAGRFKFALELIANGGLTKESMEKVAKQALRDDSQ